MTNSSANVFAASPGHQPTSAPPPPTGDSRPALAPRPLPARIPLSHAQERLWFMDQLVSDHGLYNVYQAVRIRGPLDPAALARAFDEIGRRHDVFRTRFLPDDEGPFQVICGDTQLPLARADLSDFPADQRQAELLDLIRAESRRPFSLAGDRLIRGLLVRLGADDHALLLVMHHIVSDGWTVGLLLRELAALHDAFVAGRPSPLAPLPVRFADYALWERETYQGDTLEQSLAYWRRKLDGATALELPTDRPRPAEASYGGASVSRHLPPALVSSLRQLSRAEGCTLFITLLAGFQALLHRYTAQDDIVVGSCVAGRPHLELEHLAGFFVNTIVLRTNAGGAPGFREFLRRTRQTVLEAMNHQDVPFEKIVAELQPDRAITRNPFFQVMFVLQSAGGALPQASGLAFETIEADNGTAKFDLSLSLGETDAGGINLSLEYRTDLYDAATVERLLGHYHTLLAGLAADPDCPVARLPLLAAEEQRLLLSDWNATRTPYPREATVMDAFREQVLRAPEAVAIESAAGGLRYAELDERSSRLARHLRDRGAAPGSFVALCMERSPDLIVTLLAILKAGAAYVSLDPNYPASRLGLMIGDARPALLVLQEKFRPLVEASLAEAAGAAPALVSLEADRAAIAAGPAAEFRAPATAESLAYISYTSGSTGRPKGVCIPHRGILRLVRRTDYARFGPDTVILQFAPVAFDASTFEIWGPLLNGGRLVVFPPGLPSLSDLADCIHQRGVNTVFLTTGLFHQLIDEQPKRLAGLRQMLVGGEVMSPAHAARALALLPQARLVNAYGPTENTTFTTTHHVAAPPAPGRSVPIGRPIANTSVYVLDAHRQLVPVGIPGELYTGGDGLATGYLRRPELDAERFVPHPFDPAPGARLYRTGDLVRWLADGSLEFLGRADRQVKLRGFRIEPGEIESVLTAHASVAQAAVILDSAGAAGPRLIAYVTGRAGADPDPVELRAHLQQLLPDYMVPSVIMPVPAIPLNANGKVDRAALPAPESAVVPGRAAFAAPRDPIEARMVSLWEGVLGVSPVGVDDNFFQLGGHSMTGVRLFARIEREFGRRLPLASLFECPTPAQLAARLHTPETGTTCSSLVALQPHGTRPPLFFFHGAGGGNLWTYANLIPHLGGDQPVYGLESRGMRGLAEFERIEDMAAHYLKEIRTIQPEGPYYLSGYCFGGNVAFEMARQLEAAGEQVAFLGLLDSAAANSSYQRLPWWRPEFYWRFAANMGCWFADFAAQPWRDQARFVRRKARMAARRLFGRAAAQDVEEVIDVSIFPEIELNLWKIHLRALSRYHPGRYGGRVVLFRTRGHPILCSFDPRFGWSEFAAGGIELVRLPGAHEGIFMEPHVRELSARFLAQLRAAQARHATPRPLSS